MATIFEWMDIPIYHMSGMISGHTLKHLFAAIATYWFVIMVAELGLSRIELSIWQSIFLGNFFWDLEGRWVLSLPFIFTFFTFNALKSILVTLEILRN